MEPQLADRRGDLIGGAYVLHELLGVGGMGLVYSAVQRSIDRPVVVKLPRPDLANDPRVRERFRIEALAGARVVHHNIARVIGCGEQHEVPYLVMEHIVGSRLGTLVSDTMPIATAIDLVCQILRGLGDLHAAGVVHGDVKCDNVLVEISDDGSTRPRLIDFGLARLLDQEIWCHDSLVIGTPEYLAPELILGMQPTIASDIYAVGVMLYELITGTTPFAAGSGPETMNRHLSEFAVPMFQRRVDVSDQLETVVERALAKSPSGRFSDAAAFLVALDAAGGAKGRVAPTETFSTRAQTRPIQRGGDVIVGVGSNEPERSPTVLARHAAVLALGQRDIEGYLVAHLELAHALIGDHDLAAAVVELEGATTLLYELGSAARLAPLWRLQLMLAGLYDWRGNRTRAFRLALAARAQATQISSEVGRQRAEDLLVKLGSSTAC